MRIIVKYAHICFMKARLNLTIDSALLEKMKAYAIKRDTSISELVEYYFKTVAKSTKRNNIITMLEKLEAPIHVDKDADLKELYCKDKAKKYGF